MKILLFGKNGQVGRELQLSLLPLGSIKALGFDELNLQNLSCLRDVLDEYDPDVIVNAAAYTAVDKAEIEESIAYAINAKAVEVMANYARDRNILLVHYSTDYVFDGTKSEPYLEIDITNPINIYGKSKRAGEEVVISSGCEHFIFRTSWVFSAHGHNFVKTILMLAKERNSIRVVADQYGAPTSAELLANITVMAITSYKNHKLKSGLYHLTSSGETSWYGFACFIIQQAIANGIESKLSLENIVPVNNCDYPLRAKRPQNSRLNTNLLFDNFNINPPNWKIDVESVIKKLK